MEYIDSRKNSTDLKATTGLLANKVNFEDTLKKINAKRDSDAKGKKKVYLIEHQSFSPPLR